MDGGKVMGSWVVITYWNVPLYMCMRYPVLPYFEASGLLSSDIACRGPQPLRRRRWNDGREPCGLRTRTYVAGGRLSKPNLGARQWHVSQIA